MKVIELCDQHARRSKRGTWIYDLCMFYPIDQRPSEVPTGYKDFGDSVRFQFPCGDVIEWVWRDTAPLVAAIEAQSVGSIAKVSFTRSVFDFTE